MSYVAIIHVTRTLTPEQSALEGIPCEISTKFDYIEAAGQREAIAAASRLCRSQFPGLPALAVIEQRPDFVLGEIEGEGIELEVILREIPSPLKVDFSKPV